MPTTPNYNLPYPQLSDPPNVPADLQALAEATDTVVKTVDTKVGNLDAELASTGLLIVAANTDITAPYLGQLVYNRTDRLFYRYNGTAWIIALPASMDAHGRWYAPGGQVIAATTDTPLQFATTVTATPYVTVTGTGNSIFTLTKPGVYDIHTSIRHNGANDLQLSIYQGSGGFALSLILTADDGTPTASASMSRYFAAGTAIRVNAWHPTTAATVQSNGEATHLDITYRGMQI